jgi:hypothetical protein
VQAGGYAGAGARMTGLAVEVRDDRAHLTFDRFDLDAYHAFLSVKRLPEHELVYHPNTDSYHVSTPARFASLLTGEQLARPNTRAAVAGHLFDYQDWVVRTALDAKRYACWLDTGLGKTPTYLEWARLVHEETGGRVLILEPLAVIGQVVDEATRFYGRDLPLTHLRTRDDLQAWCLGAGMPENDIGICNYDKFIPGQIPELHRIAGVVADESSILKTGGGVIKWNLIKSARGIEYKLSCTATPAPNDQMEYASQASFLEKLRNEGDVLWTYFTRDKAGNWKVKPHARTAFYRFMASWSIYMRDPARFGFGDILKDLPEPEILEYALPILPEQQRMAFTLTEAKGGLFNDDRMGVKERIRLSELAKGFLYGPNRSVQAFPSDKPRFVADLVAGEQRAGRQVLVWTSFDEEARILAELIGDCAVLDGKMTEDARAQVLQGFRRGDVPVLLSKPSLIGYGLNFQFCRSMVFSGFDDSFERVYQAVRRCYRFGQTETVRVHFPYVPELEGMVYSNVKRKEAQFLSDVAECEDAYRTAIAEVYAA